MQRLIGFRNITRLYPGKNLAQLLVSLVWASGAAFAQGPACEEQNYQPIACSTMHDHCPHCLHPGNFRCDRDFTFEVIPSGKECFYAGNPKPVDAISGTVISFSNTGSGNCELPSPVDVSACGGSNAWLARCEAGAQFNTNLTGPGSALMRMSRCCRDIGDTSRCQQLPAGPCPGQGCSIDCEGIDGLVKLYGKDLDNPNPIFPTRWPIPGDPNNTEPQWSDADGTNVTCKFEMLIENTFTVHGDNFEPAMVRVIPFHGVSCTSKNPLQAFSNTELIVTSNCGGEQLTAIDVSYVYVDNGCGPGIADFTCTFPHRPEWSDSVTASSMCASWSDGYKWTTLRKWWDSSVEMRPNDSVGVNGKICCCAGDTADCCSNPGKPLLTK